MSQHVEAIFENGVFRLLGPVEVDERALVRLAIDAPAIVDLKPEVGGPASIARQRAALAELREQMNALNEPNQSHASTDFD